jgi:hypothetical protein
MKRSEPRIFQYTIAELYNLIQQDQLIKPATEHVPPPAHYVYDLASSIWAGRPGSKRISFWTPQNVGLSGRLASKASYGSAAARASAGISGHGFIGTRDAEDRKIGIDSVIVSHLASIRSPFLNCPAVMEAAMGKYLFQVSYTAQGAKGLLGGGGGKRRAAAEQAANL